MPSETHQCATCEGETVAYNNYATGMLLTEHDFRNDQAYHRSGRHRHARLLHGSGVVCGLRVTPYRHNDVDHDCRKWLVVVEPGVAIDCCGRELVLEREHVIDIRDLAFHHELTEQAAATPVEEGAEEGAEPNGAPTTTPLRITLCYRPCPTDLVPVLYDDCAWDEDRCVPSRIRDSVAVDIVVGTRPVVDRHDGECASLLTVPDTCDHRCDGEGCVLIATVDYTLDEPFNDWVGPPTELPPLVPTTPPVEATGPAAIEGEEPAGEAPVLPTTIEGEDPGGVEGGSGADAAASPTVLNQLDHTTRDELYSTATLTSVVRCLLDRPGRPGEPGLPGEAGTSGATGADGAPGPAGVGLQPDLTHITYTSWTHGGRSPFERIDEESRGLVIGFSMPIDFARLDKGWAEVFEVEFHHRSVAGDLDADLYDVGMRCYCRLPGNVVPVAPVEGAPGQWTSGDVTTSTQYVAFALNEKQFDVWRAYVEAYPGNFEGLPPLRVTLRGDFVLDTQVPPRAIDADFVRGVGPSRATPTGDVLGAPDDPVRYGVEGGTFFSWLSFDPDNNDHKLPEA